MATPNTPYNVYVQQANGQVLISWDIASGATSYDVLRSTDGVTFASIATPSVNYYNDTSVSLNTKYYYQVKSTNGSGSSAASVAQDIIPTQIGFESLASLRLQAQQRADRVNSKFVTLPEWNKYINQSYFELYDLLVTAFEDYYLAEPYIFQTDGTNSAYTLPNGTLVGTDSVTTKPFYKLMGVDLGLANNNNAKVTIHKYDFIERNRYVYPNITSTFLGVFNMRYRIMGDKIRFIPTPSAGQYVTLWYVPRVTQLLNDTDVADGVSGWTEYIIIDAAIKALQKEESDVTILLAEKAALIKRIEDSAMNRDAGQPDTISNTRAWSGRSGQGGGPGFDGSFGGY